MSAGGSLIGRVLDDRYRVIAEIGRGGHGTVYRGVHLQLDRPVAIKVMASPSGGVERRFRREAQAQARLRHPAVVKLLDFGHDHDGNPYMVQEYVDGQSLQARFKRGIPPLDETVILIGDVLDALAEAHALGLVHRDVKPSNIMVALGPRRIEARLLDFGVVKLLDPDQHTRLTRAGVLVGTPGYMAPEQVSLLPVSPATDLYSVGVVLYQALGGRRPYGGTIKEVLRAQLHDDPPPLPSHVPADLARVALTAMCRDPAGRYPTAEAMHGALLAAFEMADDDDPTRIAPSEPLPRLPVTRSSSALPRLERGHGGVSAPPPMPTAPSLHLPGTGALAGPSVPPEPVTPRVTPSRPTQPSPSIPPIPGPAGGPTSRGNTQPPARRTVAPIALLALLLALATAGLTAWLAAGSGDGPVHRVRAGTRPDQVPPAAPTPTRPAATVLPPITIDDPDAGPMAGIGSTDGATADALADATPEPDAAVDAAPRTRRRTRRRLDRRPPSPTAPEPDAAPPIAPRVADVASVEARIDAAFDRCACDEALQLVDALARLDPASARLRRSHHRRRCRLALPGNCVTGGAP